MNEPGRKVILYISMSLDGFIATQNDDLSFLERVQVPDEDYGYHDFTKTVDTYIVGRKTYEVVKKLCGGKFPQAKDYDCYVVSRTSNDTEDGVTFISDLKSLIANLKTKPGKSIYCDGGGEIVKLLMKDQLIDEYIISIVPFILGSGKRLFIGGVSEQDLKLINCKSFSSGMVQVHYQTG